MVTPQVRGQAASARANPGGSRRMPCGTPMLLALMVWLCSLALILILVAPLLGLRLASMVGLGLLVFFVLACRAICAVRVDLGEESP